MWANAEIRDLVGRLRRARTEGGGGGGAVGFYGLDVQEPGPAMAAVVRHLRAIDPRAAEQARRRYACLTGLGEVTAGVGAAARPPSCRRGVRAQWRELVRRQQQADAGTDRGEAAFAAAQSARVVMNAEEYFSGDIGGALSAWSLRDRHMADTLDAIRAHLRRQGRSPKVVVWAHNTHVGDARASTLGQGGDLSVGQLMRRRHPAETVLVGFTTYAGSVVAASDWGAPGRAQELRPARPESHAGIFHRTGIGDFVLPLPARGPLAEELSEPRPERAVGVVYLPASEAASHYLTARLARHFDAVVHIDASRGVTPLPG
jgi:erythromycin esterase-like protein